MKSVIKEDAALMHALRRLWAEARIGLLKPSVFERRSSEGVGGNCIPLAAAALDAYFNQPGLMRL